MDSKKCAKCGLVNFPTESVCERCKSPLDAGAAGGDWSHTFGGGAQAASTGRAAARTPAASASDGLYYKPSGEVTLAGLGAGVFGGLVVGLVLAFVYAYLLAYIPFIYLNILCTLGYMFALGCVVGWLLKSGKMRNPAVGVFAATVVSLLSYYFCWAVWLSAMLGRNDFDVSAFTLATQPGTLLNLILLVNEKGAWSISHSPVTGFVLWEFLFLRKQYKARMLPSWPFAIGILACLLTFGLRLVAGKVRRPRLGCAAEAGVLTSEPFCEFCGEWCDEDRGLVSLAPAEPAGLRRTFESKEFERLRAVGAKEEGAPDWYRLDLHHCKRCDRTNTLTVKSEKITFDSKGRSKVRSTNLFSKLVLAPNEVEDLRRVSREMPRGAPAHAPQAPAAQV